MEILCKWNGKVEYLQWSPVCSGKFPFEPLFTFAFQLVEPEILAKWKAPLVSAYVVLFP